MKPSSHISREQAGESADALVLLLLLAYLFHPSVFLIYGAVAALIMKMTFPVLFIPFAVFWFTFSDILGKIFSWIIFALIFLLVLTPVSLFMRGADPMQKKKWKKADESLFYPREHTYTFDHIANPY